VPHTTNHSGKSGGCVGGRYFRMKTAILLFAARLRTFNKGSPFLQEYVLLRTSIEPNAGRY
jgi:hypothetical protein